MILILMWAQSYCFGFEIANKKQMIECQNWPKNKICCRFAF